jgi:ankyrin repeat protein
VDAVRAWIAANELSPARFCDAVQADPCSVMFGAIQADAAPIVVLMLDGGVPVEIGDGDHNTPLNIAARHDRIEIARLLIARGADVQAQTERGYTPAQFARSEAMLALLR